MGEGYYTDNIDIDTDEISEETEDAISGDDEE